MNIKLMEDIKTAEHRAEKMVREARVQAGEIIDEARKTAQNSIIEAEQRRNGDSKTIIAAAEKKALEKVEKIRDVTKLKCVEIRTHAEAKMSDAAKFIVSVIVKE